MSVLKRWNGTSWEVIGPQISSTRFDDINHMIAPEYSSTDTYNVGDYVIQNDKLYKCISVIESAEEWTAAHWSQVLIGEEVSDLKSAFSDLILIKYSGSYTTVNADLILCNFNCPISIGDKVKISTSYTGIYQNKIDIRFYDDNEVIHAIQTNQPIGTDYEFIAQDNYTRVSFFKTLTNLEPGKIFSANITVNGKILKNIDELNEDINELNEDIDELNEDINNIKNTTNLIQTLYQGNYTTIGSSIILCNFNCIIHTGDTIIIDTSYTGSNTTTYDIRFYDSNGTLQVIKSGQQIGMEYTFIAENEYTSASFYSWLTNIKQGEIFSANVWVSGEVINNINTINNNITTLNNNIEDINNNLSIFNVAAGNLMPDLSEWMIGRVYNGVYSDAITTVRCTDYIPVSGGKTYYIYGGYISQEYFGVYDKNKNILSGWQFDSLTQNNNKSKAIITLNQNAAYIRINILYSLISDFPNDAYISLYPNNLPKIADMSNNIFRAKGSGTLSDKKILIIGDSISTDIYGSYKKWVTYLCEQGFFSQGFVTNNSYHATGYVATYKESGIVKQDTFLNRIIALGDLSEYNLIITFGGINDWIQSIDFNDFKDAVDNYYSYLIENATQARIAVISPMKTSLYGTINNVSKTQKDYADYIKEVANEYSFPLLNLTDESGFCPNKSTTFRDTWTFLPPGFSDHDGVHPTTEWEKKYLAPQIAWFLAKLI